MMSAQKSIAARSSGQDVVPIWLEQGRWRALPLCSSPFPVKGHRTKERIFVCERCTPYPQENFFSEIEMLVRNSCFKKNSCSDGIKKSAKADLGEYCIILVFIPMERRLLGALANAKNVRTRRNVLQRNQVGSGGKVLFLLGNYFPCRRINCPVYPSGLRDLQKQTAVLNLGAERCDFCRSNNGSSVVFFFIFCGSQSAVTDDHRNAFLECFPVFRFRS